jgi:hypothetical protein
MGNVLGICLDKPQEALWLVLAYSKHKIMQSSESFPQSFNKTVWRVTIETKHGNGTMPFTRRGLTLLTTFRTYLQHGCRQKRQLHYYFSSHNKYVRKTTDTVLLFLNFVDRTCQMSTVGGSADSRLRRTTRTSCRIYTSLPPDDGQLATPKHVEV